MEIYTDKTQGKAVIVVNTDELGYLYNGQFWAVKHWYEKATDENVDGYRADISKEIGDKHANIGIALENANKELKGENPNKTTED